MKWGTVTAEMTSEWHRAFAYILTQVEHGEYKDQWIWLRHYWWRWSEPTRFYSGKYISANSEKPLTAKEGYVDC